MGDFEPDLYEELNRYADSDMYPFHMPGHKRKSLWRTDPYTMDITEVEGFDDLHHPEGRLRDSMEWAAGIYGADKTYYLVDGSTCGILAAVSAAVPFGGKLILARNAHKSAYNAAALNHLQTAMIYPQKVDKLGIFGGISPQNVDNILSSNADAKAVLVVSPTYDGVISDMAAIAEVVHRYGIPLIVDEAHGAHLRFTSRYKSALDCGADVVIQSLHKTLPSLTQTAVLHVKGDRIDTGKLERYLQVYQSSSPSYILLGSIEECIRVSAAQAPAQWDAHYDRITAFRKSLSWLSSVSLPGDEELRGICSIYDLDLSRLIISLRGCILRDEGAGSTAERAVSGRWLAGVLRRRFHIETEMAGDSYVLALTTPYDSDEGFERLGEALKETDRELVRIHEPVKRRNPRGDGIQGKNSGPGSVPADGPEVIMTIADALDADIEAVSAEESEGRTAAEFAYLYPPGIPLIVPGERIDESTVRCLSEWREKGFTPRGMADKSGGTIRVVRQPLSL